VEDFMSFTGHKNIGRYDGSNSSSWETYVCGHCGVKVTGAVAAGYVWTDSLGNNRRNQWLLCTNCFRPSAKLEDNIFPGISFGPILQGLPSDVEESYEEARCCMKVNAYTAAELICRKILMHVAVEKGAKEGKSFAEYLSHLEAQGYITPPMKGWVDLIRKNGNESTHKLDSPDEKRAKSTVMFTAELLRLTYEMEFLANQYAIASPKKEES
jgi:Domain of unknown function (DUF4145)